MIYKLIFLCIILDYKNMQFKQLIDSIAIDLGSSRDFASIDDIRRKCNPMYKTPQLKTPPNMHEAMSLVVCGIHGKSYHFQRDLTRKKP